MKPENSQGHLPRLKDEAYKGWAIVHWTQAVQNRKTGWLKWDFHLKFREALLHASVRYYFICPVYCLMPDHIHMLWMGMGLNCNQRHGITFLRKHTQEFLKPFGWQQPYDHVLREDERKKEAFQRTAYYILKNPVRAGLVETSGTYSYSGAMVPGYPELDPHDADFWKTFWKIDAKLRKPLL